MSYSSEVLADSPQAFWLFDETSGTSAADSSGNSRTLTYSGATLNTNPIFSGSPRAALGGASGQGVGSIAWNGAWMSQSTFTVSMWVKPGNRTDVKGLFAQWTSGAGGWIVWQRREKIGIYCDNGATTQESDGPIITVSQPSLITIRRSGSTLDLLVNGVVRATIAITVNFTATTPPLQVGGYNSANYSQAYFAGAAYFNTALSDARILAHYAAGTLRTLTPKAHWKLDETSGTTMADSSGNGNDATYSVGTGGALGQTALRGTGFAAKGGSSSQGLGSKAATATTPFDSAEFTIAVTYKAVNTSSAKGIISRWSGTPLGWILWQNSGKINFFLNGGSSLSAELTGPTIDTSNAHRYTVTVNGLTAALYVDGSLYTSATMTFALNSSSTAIQIGGYNLANYSEGYFDDIKFWDTALTSGEVSAEYSTSTTGAAAVTAPAPTGSGSGVATNTGAGAVTAPAATGSGSGTSTVTGSGAVTAPAPVGAGVGTSDDTTFGSGAVTAPAPTASGSGTSTVTGAGDATAPAATGSGSGTSTVTGSATVTAPAPTVAGAGTVTGGGWSPGDTLEVPVPVLVLGGVTALEVFTPSTGSSDVITISVPVQIGVGFRIAPVPVDVPADIATLERPIMRRAHLMDPKSPANPRKMGSELRDIEDGDDGYNYPIHVEQVASRLRIFASGFDITYLTGAPTTVQEWSFAKPFGPQAASFFVPLPEWNHPGPEGDMPIFWGDASIEICLEDDEGNLRHLWEGYTGEEVDVAAPGRTGVTWNCEGTFQQASHWLWDAPRWMPERDYGHVIADALNSVPNHRWAKIPRFTTGQTTTDRGDSSESVLAYVARLMGKLFDDDGNQLRLHRNGPYSYSLMWAYPITDPPHVTFTKGSPGFESTLSRPHYARRDMTFARGIAPDGGYWNGSVFPGLMAAAPPVYPIAGFGNMTVGTTDADTVGGNGVTTWQRKMRELGYPVVVDGVINANDTKWIVEIERKRGILDTGVLGPQTWAATWEGGADTPETLSYRLPLSIKPNSREFNYDASGKIIGRNPQFGRNRVLHATPEVDAGTNIKKTSFIPAAHKIRNREASPGYVGSLVATGVDPHETGVSRLFIAEGMNVYVAGHHGGVTVQTSDVTHTPTTTRMTVDAGARGQAVVDAVLSRQKDARRSLAGKSTKTTDRGTLNASQLGQYESESPAGKYSRTAINGDAGLWTVRCIYVAEQGLARFRFTTSPNAEIVTTIWDRPVTANYIASRVPDPLDDADGWYDHEAEMKAAGLIEVLGTPDNPGGYFPRQKPDEGSTLTGVQAAGNLSLKSARGGFFWVGAFTSRSTFLEGEFEPEVPTN